MPFPQLLNGFTTPTEGLRCVVVGCSYPVINILSLMQHVLSSHVQQSQPDSVQSSIFQGEDLEDEDQAMEHEQQDDLGEYQATVMNNGLEEEQEDTNLREEEAGEASDAEVRVKEEPLNQSCLSAEEKLTCCICSKTGYKNKKSLKEHLRKLHGKHRSVGSRQSHEVCPETFSAPTEVNASALACKVCSKLLTSMKLLRAHEREQHNLHMDSDLGKLICNFCGRAFQEYPLLESHVEDDHKDMFRCRQCYKIFSSHKGMRQHVRLHHP